MPSFVLPLGLLLARLIVGVILLVFGFGKLHAGRDRLLRAILGYEVVSGFVARTISVGLPPAEVLAGVLLVAGVGVEWAALGAFAMLSVFTLAITRSLVRGLANDCGCSGSLNPVRWRLAYRNLSLMFLCIPILIWGGGAFAASDLLAWQTAVVPFGALVFATAIWGSSAVGILVLRVRDVGASRSARATGT